jgi:hypothetical protein
MTILRDLNDWLPAASDTELTMALRVVVEEAANRADARVAEDLVVERARADFRAARFDENGVASPIGLLAAYGPLVNALGDASA